MTGHHPRHSSHTNSMKTKKRRDYEYRMERWKDGETYTYAIFDSVELDGTTVTAHLCIM